MTSWISNIITLFEFNWYVATRLFSQKNIQVFEGRFFLVRFKVITCLYKMYGSLWNAFFAIRLNNSFINVTLKDYSHSLFWVGNFLTIVLVQSV